jgi:hypothetical protein
MRFVCDFDRPDLAAPAMTVPVRLEANLQEMRRFEDAAAEHLARGSENTAAAIIQMAGSHAWHHHPGMFASRSLEDVALSVAERLAGAEPSDPLRSRTEPRTRRVLHVLTQAYETGGHTRLVAGWIKLDPASRHDICLTQQLSFGVPRVITDVLAQTGGNLVALDSAPGGLCKRGVRLRRLAAGYDIVLLHTHPFDIVPLLGLLPDGGRAVVLVNHADHVFWLGTSVSTAVLNLRESGRRLCVERRGVREDRALLLPLPLVAAQRSCSSAEAKRRLGIPADSVVILTVGSANKFVAINRPSFIDLNLAVVERHDSTFLVAVGPGDSGPWRSAKERTKGRLRAVGLQAAELNTFFDAADVYVDSYPLMSPTALLEAGVRGIPAVSYRAFPEEAAVLSVDTPGIDGRLLGPTNPLEYESVLEELIQDACHRRSLGLQLRESILSSHCGGNWAKNCHHLYESVLDLPRASTAGDGVAAQTALDLLLELVQIRSGKGDRLFGTVYPHLALLPLPARLAAYTKLRRRHGGDTRLRELLPEWPRNQIRRSIRRSRAQ